MHRSEIASSSPNLIRRRRFLAGLTVATLPMLAGCTSQTEGTFPGTPVYIDADDAAAIGLVEVTRDDWTETVEGSAFGLGVSATVTSHYSVYQADDSDSALIVSALSTPKARVMFDQRNDLADISGQRLLYNDDVRWFHEPARLDEIDRDWERNSTRLLSERVDEILGDVVRITSRGGFLEDEEQPSVVFVHYGKVDKEDGVVFLFAVRQWSVDDTSLPLIGEDGILTEDEFAADLVATRTAFSAFQLG